MNTHVRPASEYDVPDILELLYELGRPRSTRDADVFENLVKRYMSDDDKSIMLACTNNIVIGMASTMVLSRLNQVNLEMYVPEIIVSKEFQGTGVGKMLIDACIKLARKNNCHRIRLESANYRKESHAFYKKMGFNQSALSFSMDLR